MKDVLRRISLFIILWLAILTVSYGITFIIFPKALTGTRSEFEGLVNQDFLFLIITQFLLLLGTLLAVYITVVKIESRSLSSVSLSIRFVEVIKGFVIGLTLISLVSLMLQSAGLISFQFTGITENVWKLLALHLVVSIAEEVFSRGYLLNTLIDGMNPNIALVISSILFALLHIFNSGIELIGFFNIMFSGLLMGLLYLKSRNLSLPIGMHWGWNFSQGAIFGFAVSGHQSKGIFTPNLIGSKILTGGDFGAEGSLLLIPLVIISIYLVSKYL